MKYRSRITLSVVLLILFVINVSASEFGIVKCDVLNVRESPNTQCNVVDKMPYGTGFEIIYTDNGWYNIRMENGVTGFVSANYVHTGDSQLVLSYQNGEVGQKVAELAHNFIGCTYVYGTAGPSTFDCSGFTSYLYKQYGYKLPRTSNSQGEFGIPVDKKELLPGDILCFSNRRDRKINHVGIYVGDGMFIHASTSIRGVVKDNLNSDYYTKNYICARRIV